MSEIFYRVPQLDPEVTSVKCVYDDGTIKYDADLKAGSDLWADYQTWLAEGNTLDAPLEPLPAMRQRLSDSIDSIVAGIYSNWTRFQQEYLSREAAAIAFKAANYEGDPGIWISAFVTASGMDSKSATDLILVQSVALRASLEQMAALRMRKYEVMNAQLRDEIQSTYDDIIKAIQAVAATIK